MIAELGPSPVLTEAKRTFSRDEEIGRAKEEYAEFCESDLCLGEGIPRGNGETIWLKAGTFGSKTYLQPTAAWFERLGYSPANLDGFQNMASLFDIWRAEQELLLLYRKTQQPVIAIGHSNGAVIQRLLAFKHPEMFTHLIGLAGPIGKDNNGKNHTYTQMLVSMQRTTDIMLRGKTRVPYNISDPLPEGIGSTYIYTRDDLVVNPQLCLDPNPGADNRWVNGSHLGLMYNTEALGHTAKDILPNTLQEAA